MLPISSRHSPANGGWIEPLEARIAPANFVLPAGGGPFTLELDPVDSHLHIIGGAGGEIFDQGLAPGDDLFVTGGNASDTFIIGGSAAGNVSYTGTLSVVIPGRIMVADSVGTGVDLVLNSTAADVRISAVLALGASSAHFTAAENIFLNNSTLTTNSGDIVLAANQGPGQNGSFAGITLNLSTITTTGTGKIMLAGKGGNLGNDNVGIALLNNSFIASNSTLPTAGTITLVGQGGAALANNHGVFISSFSTISADRGAISVTGTGGGSGSGNNVGVLLANGGQIVAPTGGPGAASITVGGTGGGGVSFNHGVSVDGTNGPTGISSVDGAIVITGQGGLAATGQGSRGISIERGGQISATVAGTINLQGTGGGGTDNRQGILISDAGSSVTSAAGIAVLAGSGGPGAVGAGNNGVLISSGGKVSSQSVNGISIDGIVAGGPSEGLLLTGANTLVESTGTGGVILRTNHFSIDANALVNAGAGGAALQPSGNNFPINLGGADVPGAVLGISDAELDRITGSRVTIGNNLSGAINVSAAITSARQLLLSTSANVSGVGSIMVVAGSGLVVTATGGIDLGGAIDADGINLIAGAGAAITLANPANKLGGVFSNGGTISLRDDSGFDLLGANVGTLLTVESAATITQSAPITGAGGVTKVGAGDLIFSADNTYTGTTTINGGTLQVGNGGANGTLGAGSVVNNSQLTFNRSDMLTATNAISGPGSVTKTGTGILTLTANNPYSGTTTVAGGTLLVDGTLANTASVGVGTAGALGGNGTIAAPVNVSGTLLPGGSPGTLATGLVTFQPASKFTVEINGIAPNHDQLAVTGTVNLNNAALNTSGNLASAPGQQIVIIANDGVEAINGTFSGLAEGDAFTVNGLPFTISYAGGTDNNDVVLKQAPAGVETRVTLNNGNLVINDITAGGHRDTLTIRTHASTGELLIVDPVQLLEVVGVPGASLSLDQHTVTVPLASITGTQILVNTLAGDDALTVDVTEGPLTKTIIYDGGQHGVGGDKLAFAGLTSSSFVVDFTGLTDGSVALPGSLPISFTGTEVLSSAVPTASLTLNYNIAAGATIDISGGVASTTVVALASGVTVDFFNPSTSLTINGGSGADSFNVASLGTPILATLSLHGQGGTDDVNLAAGLPGLRGLTITTETIGALPALVIGAGGLDITASADGIHVNGGITSTGRVALRSSDAITNTAGIVTTDSLVARAVNGITLAISGADVQATNTGVGGITLTAVNNPVSLTAADAGLGPLQLNGAVFRLAKANAIATTPPLVVNSLFFDLNQLDLTVSNLSGVGTISNASATFSTLSVGDDSTSTFAGSITGRVALVKTGTGKLTLSGAGNSYDGGTRVRAGTLQFDTTGAALSGVFDLVGGTLFYNFSGALSPILSLSANSTIGVGTGQTVTLTDPISGPGGLTKTGAGTLVLTNANNSFGGQKKSAEPTKVRILDGTLQVPNDGALGDVANDVEIDNATFAASASFASARNFTKTGGVASIDALVPTLSLINKAIVVGDLTPTVPANLGFTFPYLDTTPVLEKAITIGNTQVAVAGGGTLIIHKTSPTSSTIDTIEITGSTSATKLIITAVNPGMVTTVNRIVIDDNTPGVIASIGSIVLGKNVFLGDGVRDSVPDLYVEGKVGKLTLDGVNSYALIDLGEGLPYEILRPDGKLDKTKPSTKTNQPAVTIRAVLGPGVVIDLTPSDLPPVLGQLVGGGGLGKVVVGAWDFSGPVPTANPGLPGLIRTTQSIGSFKLLQGNCSVVFEVDKLGVGTATTANVGSMTIQNGSWGSSGSEIEGDVGSFNADAFLAGATLTAGGMGKFSLDAGAFAGLLGLTDPDSASIPTFVVATDFSGTVISESALQKIRVKGNFTGELQATFIGSITAYAFLGTDTPGEYNQIIATEGSLGTLTASAGAVKNFAIVTDQAFKGFNVKLSKLANSTVGIDNVHIEALSIGNISVNLAAAAGATIDLVGIRNSEFIATGTGTTKTTLGSVGKISVTLTGSASSAGSTGITGVFVSANANVGAITVKSKVLAHGTIENSEFLAGQALVLNSGTTLATLAIASLGAVNVSGSIVNTELIAGGSIRAVTAGHSMTDSLILAGALLGADGELGGVSADSDTFQRAASIASVTVKGASGGLFARTSIVAGVDPVNGIFGDTGDAVGSAAGLLSNTSSIGPVSIPAGVLTAAAGSQYFAIEAARIASLKAGPAAAASITSSPKLLDLAPSFLDADDIMVRLVS